jgi:hypothetical protein
MKPVELAKVYNFMKEHALEVDAVFTAALVRGGVPGPAPGVHLEGRKWRDYEARELVAMRRGDLGLLSDHVEKSVYIGHVRHPLDRARDPIPGEYDFRDLNATERHVFSKAVAPTLATIGQLHQFGLLKWQYFDDEGDNLDHYGADGGLVDALQVGNESVNSLSTLSFTEVGGWRSPGREVSLRTYVVAKPISAQRSSFYATLSEHPLDRRPLSEAGLVRLDSVVSGLYESRMPR